MFQSSVRGSRECENVMSTWNVRLTPVNIYISILFRHNAGNDNNKFGFKSAKNPPTTTELEAFKRELFGLIKRIKFWKYSNAL